MSENFQHRTKLLLGEKADLFPSFRVAIFGIGGVGGYVAETLARCGIGTIALIDHDIITESNINRQVIALNSTLRQPKAEVMKARILDINPECNVTAYNEFFSNENYEFINLKDFDYVADCIDYIGSKVFLVTECKELNVPIISVMGAGNKLNTDFKIANIYKTDVCPMCKIMRKQLKEKDIKQLDVVYSEEPVRPMAYSQTTQDDGRSKKFLIGSLSYVTAAAGITAAGHIIKKLIKEIK